MIDISGSHDIQCLDKADILTGQWPRQGLIQQPLNLFETSSSSFFCDFGAGQLCCPDVYQSIDNTIILTFVSITFTYQQLLGVLRRLEAEQLSFLAVKTLSIHPVALEVYCRHDQSVAFDQVWWQGWLDFTATLALDLGFKPNAQHLQRVRLACFDMDSTLIQAEVIDELAAEAGLKAQVSAITESAMRGDLDFKQSFTQRLGMLQGLSDSAVETVMQRIPLMDGAEQLFQFLQQQGIYTAILSGGFDVFAHRVQRQLQINEVHSNTLEFAHQQLTGQVVLPIMDAERKRSTLIQLAKNLHIPLSQTLAVGDGANDLMMLKSAGAGIAYKAKPKVQGAARMVIRYGDLSYVPYFLGFTVS